MIPTKIGDWKYFPLRKSKKILIVINVSFVNNKDGTVQMRHFMGIFKPEGPKVIMMTHCCQFLDHDIWCYDFLGGI